MFFCFIWGFQCIRVVGHQTLIIIICSYICSYNCYWWGRAFTLVTTLSLLYDDILICDDDSLNFKNQPIDVCTHLNPFCLLYLFCHLLVFRFILSFHSQLRTEMILSAMLFFLSLSKVDMTCYINGNCDDNKTTKLENKKKKLQAKMQSHPYIHYIKYRV